MDNLGRNNHLRCKILCDKLKKLGYKVWFDHYDMNDSIDNSILKSIDEITIFLVCLTEVYCNKINRAINEKKINDNCFKEWNYALYKNKIIIPVLMEPKMKDILSYSDGPIQMYLNTFLYFDLSTDDYQMNDFFILCRVFRKHGIYNEEENKLKQLKDNSSFNSFLEYIIDHFRVSYPPTSPPRRKTLTNKNNKCRSLIYI